MNATMAYICFFLFIVFFPYIFLLASILFKNEKDESTIRFLLSIYPFKDTSGDGFCHNWRFRDTLGSLASPINIKWGGCLWSEDFCFTRSMVEEKTC